ncbi:hypothetical protein RM530_05625, partial [Algiphilus sp. W345]
MANRTTDAEVRVGADLSDAESNLNRFEAEFEKTLKGLNDKADIGAIRQIASDLDANRVSVEQLDPRVAELVESYRGLRDIAKARDTLQLLPHAKLEGEAKSLRAAYDTLKSSGKLTSTELAQANLKLQQGLIELERRTNGWKDAVVSAKGELLTSAAAFAPIGYAIKQAVD